MINASARMELAISGQIGQPAACMMESKRVSALGGKLPGDYGAQVCVRAGPGGDLAHAQFAGSPTEIVDKLVQNPGISPAHPLPERVCVELLTNSAP
jgi:hypothetical protein